MSGPAEPCPDQLQVPVQWTWMQPPAESVPWCPASPLAKIASGRWNLGVMCCRRRTGAGSMFASKWGMPEETGAAASSYQAWGCLHDAAGWMGVMVSRSLANRLWLVYAQDHSP